MLKIVVSDPEGVLPEGKLIDGQNQLSVLEKRPSRVIMLPVDPDLIYSNAVGGYFKRAWGSGWNFTNMRAERGCPMMLYAQQAREFIHWCARVVPLGDDPRGIIRLTSNTSQLGSVATAGLSLMGEPNDISTLGPPDSFGGWTLFGKARLSIHSDGYIGFNLYGVANNLSVLWSAVSQSKYE